VIIKNKALTIPPKEGRIVQKIETPIIRFHYRTLFFC